MKLKVLDLFAGVGGFSYGFAEAGFEIVGAIEFDKSIARSMKLNHVNTKVFDGDIMDIDIKMIRKELGKIDIIIGGPPCQGFSLKGKRKGMGDKRNFLFEKYIEYIEFFKPKYFVMENVPNILSDQNGYFKNEILERLKKLNYNVEYGILDASDFGVPQKRRRAFFIGSKNKKNNLPIPKKQKKITAWEALSDLAYLKSGEGEFESLYLKKAETPYQKKMRSGSKKLFNHVATNHSDIAIDRLKRIPPGKGKEFLIEKISSTFGNTWGRLEKNKPSQTIITRFDTPSNGKNSHFFLHRSITPREAARLQSFPDTFVFHGNKSSIIKQIGNAVPPLLAKALAKNLL